MPTIADLIDYLSQFDSDTRVFLTEEHVDEPCEFITLDTAISQFANGS